MGLSLGLSLRNYFFGFMLYVILGYFLWFLRGVFFLGREAALLSVFSYNLVSYSRGGIFDA